MQIDSESTLLVRPEHLNHHGYLFGGRLLEWLDEQAYICIISMLKPEVNLVTIAIDRVEFRYPVGQGSLLHFRSTLVHVGTTSCTVFTQVFLHEGPGDEEIFRAYVTFVCLDVNGQPRAIGPLLLKPFSRDSLMSETGRAHWDEVERGRRARSAHPR